MSKFVWAGQDNACLAHAVEENLWSLWRNFALGPDSAFHELHGALCLETPIKSPPYNMVMNFKGAPDPSAQIDRVLDHFSEREVPLVWLVSPGSCPADLGRHLETRGMTLAEVMPAMTAPLDRIDTTPPALADGIQITEASPQDADEIFHFVSYRWNVAERDREMAHGMYARFNVGRPGSPVRSWIARRDGAVVGKSVLHLGAGVAGVHGVAVLPQARGAGLGRALTLKALDAAKAAGFDTGALGSSPMAEGLYRAIGFDTVGAFSLYAPDDDFHV